MATNSDQHDYDKLNQVLNMPDTPDNLEKSLFENFDKQIIEEEKAVRKKKRNRLFFSSSLAASLFIGLAIVLRINIIASPVELAYEHAQEEKLMTGHIDGGYKQWMSERGIAIPVNAEAIILSKNCLIGEVKAKHLRFELDGFLLQDPPNGSRPNSVLKSKGVINLFIQTARDKSIEAKDTSGDINGQKWILFKTGKEMEVLVLYENDSYKIQVDEIIKSMFPDRGKIVI